MGNRMSAATTTPESMSEITVTSGKRAITIRRRVLTSVESPRASRATKGERWQRSKESHRGDKERQIAYLKQQYREQTGNIDMLVTARHTISTRHVLTPLLRASAVANSVNEYGSNVGLFLIAMHVLPTLLPYPSYAFTQTHQGFQQAVELSGESGACDDVEPCFF